MSIGMEVGVFLAYAFGVLMVYVFGRFLLIPLKWILYCMISSLAGGMLLLILNNLFDPLGFFVPVNLITAGIAGILGVPGMLLMLIFFCM